MTKAPALLTLSMIICNTAMATITWQSDLTVVGYTLKDLDNTLLTNGSNGTVGFLGQLIRDVDGDGIDPVSELSVTGVSGDDVVVDVAWIGSGGVGSGSPGIMRPQTGEAHVDGAFYYVRMWNAPTQATYTLGNGNENTPRPFMNVISGLNSLGKPLRYGESARFQAAGSDITLNTFDFQAVTNKLFPGAVPEAGTAGLAGLGMLVLRRFLRRKTT